MNNNILLRINNIVAIIFISMNFSGCSNGLVTDSTSPLSMLNLKFNTVPAIINTNPANGSTNVNLSSNIVVNFNTAIDPATVIPATFYVIGGGVTISGTITTAGNSAILDPASDLSPTTTYTATVTTGVTDLTGVPISSVVTWTFTTGAAPDITPPTVAPNYPIDGETGVPVNSSITMDFSEPMNAATLTGAITVTDMILSMSVTGTVAYSGLTATFIPSSDLIASNPYRIDVSTAAQDLAGNGLSATNTWFFTTGAAPDITPPFISAATPGIGATDIDLNDIIDITFSEAINPTTVNTGTVTLYTGGTPVSGTITAISSDNYTFTPDAPLLPGSTYVVTVSNGVTDLAGNAMGVNIWSFTTGYTPANNAQGLKFTDFDNGEDSVGGTCVIQMAADESDIDSYVLYWGSDATTKLAAPQIIEMSKTGSDIPFTLFAGLTVPAGATHMLVYSKNVFGESATPVALDFDDMVCRMIEINPGSGDSMPSNFAVYNNRLYLSADDGSTMMYELWVFDDSLPIANGTNPKMAVNINPSSSSFPMDLTVYNGLLYFGVNDGSNGSALMRELWVYDDAGPSCNLAPGTLADSEPKYLKAYGGNLYYQGWDASNGIELHEYNGSTEGVYDIYSGSGDSKPAYLTVFGGYLYFQANNGNFAPNHGAELWDFDGTANRVTDINPGINDSSPSFMTPFLGNLYFQAYDNSAAGIELWQYNGTVASLVNGYDINPAGHSNPSDLYVYNNRLYFRAEDGANGQELWIYDGAVNPFMVDIYGGTNSSYPKSFTECNGKLYFSADNGVNGQELWVYDGTMPIVIGDNIRMACEINTAGSSYVDYLFNYNGRLYFQATDGTNGYELWCYYVK